MDYKDLRAKYPKFIYDSFTHQFENDKLIAEFKYSIPPDHTFTHRIKIENLQLTTYNLPHIDNLVFNLGLAEMFSYWKLTSSPTIELTTYNQQLTTGQLAFWHKLLINGLGQYFYENQIDFTQPDFLQIQCVQEQVNRSAGGATPKGKAAEHLQTPASNALSILVPIGGGKDSIVTAEILKNHFPVRPVIVTPTTPASFTIAQMLSDLPPIIARRDLDPYMLGLTSQGYLTGHIPYSSVLAFIFVLAAGIENIGYIAVSNEASSDEGNVKYLGHTINHQYSKSSEFETDFNIYVKSLTTYNLQPTTYFSFLRPLHELQIAKLFAKYPQYFPVFKSCNRHQQQNSWCGKCSKCISIALSLIPWTSTEVVTKIMGSNPLTDPANQLLLSQMTDPKQVKPFECIVSTHEAKICLEFIFQGPTSPVKEFLSQWGPSPNSPPQFIQLLKQAYANP